MNRQIALTLCFNISCIEYNPTKQDPKDGDRPEIKVIPELADFGYLIEGESSAESFRVTNIGSATLDIDEIKLQADAGFTITLPNAFNQLEPNESMNFIVEYSPESDAESGFVQIDSNDPSDQSLEIPLVGKMALPMLSINPNPYVFNWAEIGQVSEGEINLVSSGEAPVEITQTLLLGEVFTMTELILPITLDPGESVSVPVQFTPLSDGTFEGELWVNNSGLTPSTMGKIFGYSGAGDIKGRICDTSGDGWVVGAKVWVSIDLDGDGIEDLYIEATTDADGYFTLEGLPPGNYIIMVEKGSFTTSFPVEFPGGVFELPEDECLLPDSVDIAVVMGEYDHIEGILGQLDLEFDLFDESSYLDLILNSNQLNEYDIVFFNCGMPFTWLDQLIPFTSNLADFVQNGGSVYASDWAHAVVEGTWPTYIDFLGNDSNLIDPYLSGTAEDTPYWGVASSVTAGISDPTMAGAVGSSSAALVYDLDAWVVPIDASTDANVMIRGDALIWDTDYITQSTLTDVPLAIQFSPGSGRVIFTTFHNEAQLTTDMEAALKEIILSL